MNESFPIEIVGKIAREFLPGYSLRDPNGGTSFRPVQAAAAAAQFVRDITNAYLLIPLIETLMQIANEGLMGRQYAMPLLTEIVRELAQDGLAWNPEVGLFIENPFESPTPNWRRLREGGEYGVTLLRFDIVDNTGIVRTNDKEAVRTVFEDLRSMVQRSAEKRNGRIWSFEGDGGIVAFLYANRDVQAVLAGMELLNGLFLYNRFRHLLNAPVRIRIAVHNGICRYSALSENLQQDDTIKKLKLYESTYTEADTLTVSSLVAASLDRLLSSRLKEVRVSPALTLWRYALCWEETA